MSTGFDKHIKLLVELEAGKLGDLLHADEGADTATLLELIGDGLATCSNHHQIKGVAEHDIFVNTRITIQGRRRLETWRREQRESGFWWQMFHVLKRGAVWLAFLGGVAATKVVELSVEKWFK